MIRLVTATIIVLCTDGMAMYLPHYRLYTMVNWPAESSLQANPLQPSPAEPTLQETYDEQQSSQAPPPPPPPFPGTPQPRRSPPEPLRSLVGISIEDLKEFERYLPEGAQIYTYPVGETSLAAAIISADLDGDGRDETVLAYNERKPTREEGSLPLTLVVLVREGNKLKPRASTQMIGGVLFSVSINGGLTHLAVLDVTGDGHPEIVIAQGTGASIGGWLEVYSFDGSALHELARIGGHVFKVGSGGKGKPSIITARSRYETGRRTYRWTGKSFDEAEKRPTKWKE